MDPAVSASAIQSLTTVATWLVGGLATIIGVLILARLKKIEDKLESTQEKQGQIKEEQARYEERFKSLFNFKRQVERRLGWNGRGENSE